MMKPYLKKLAKKYIPSFLHPYVYNLYSCVHYLLNLAKFYLAIYKSASEVKNSDTLKKLASLQTIQILQPTFYDLDGNDYFSGGAERYLNDLSNIIISMGYTPFIVQQGNRFWHKKHNGIDVFGAPSGGSLRLLNKFAHMSYFGKPKIRIYSPFTLAFPNFDKNSIGISHGIFWDQPHSANLLPTIIRSFLHLKVFVSVDTSTLSWLRGTIPSKLSSNNMKYIPNYVDLKDFYPVAREHNGRITIIYPRKLYYPRGYLNVIAIADSILSKYPEVDLHFVGHADSLAIKEANKLITKFKNRVLIYQEPDNNMNKIYRKADIVLIPTVSSEGTSLSCLEAMATGRAIIATNVGGLSDLIIDGYNGLLIGPSAEELQKAIEKLIDNQRLRNILGNNALEVAKCFDKNIWQSRWVNILNEVINKVN